MTGLFFTGTDTGVGKTVIAAAVARWLRARGERVAVSKPVATGAEGVDGQWLSDDTRRLGEAIGSKHWPRITPWTFADPVAPAVAARRQGTRLELSHLVDAVHASGEDADCLIVEGVGGLLCPLTESDTVADLVAALGLPLVVVARRSLGTLNHTLLTLEVARTRGLSVAGVVVNETTPPATMAEETNVEELTRRIAVPLLAVVPYRSDPSSDVPPALAAVDWWQLCHRVAST